MIDSQKTHLVRPRMSEKKMSDMSAVGCGCSCPTEPSVVGGGVALWQRKRAELRGGEKREAASLSSLSLHWPRRF